MKQKEKRREVTNETLTKLKMLSKKKANNMNRNNTDCTGSDNNSLANISRSSN